MSLVLLYMFNNKGKIKCHTYPVLLGMFSYVAKHNPTHLTFIGIFIYGSWNTSDLSSLLSTPCKRQTFHPFTFLETWPFIEIQTCILFYVSGGIGALMKTVVHLDQLLNPPNVCGSF